MNYLEWIFWTLDYISTDIGETLLFNKINTFSNQDLYSICIIIGQCDPIEKT